MNQQAKYRIYRQANCGDGRFVVVEGTGDNLRTGVFSSESLAEARREAAKWEPPANVTVLDSDSWIEVGY
jgi:hypothetical protein